MRSGRNIWDWRAILAALSLALVAAAPAHAQNDFEDAVKATFIYRFGSFAAWPAATFAAPEAPFVICMTGSASLADLVERTVQGQHIGGRNVELRRLAVIGGGSGCHIIFIEGIAQQSVRDALAAVDGEPVLTVTDARNGAARGIIHFTVVDGRVRFRIDRAAAARNRIDINARLLALALSVDGGRS